jgi:acetolactate synthase-1/2/3 large subunit
MEELAEMLTKAKNPVIIAEEAGRDLSTVNRIVELAELLGSPVVETRSAGYENFPRSHPLHGGFDPKEYVRDADLFFLLGAVAPWHPPSAGPGADIKVVALDDNPGHADLPFWGFRVDRALAGSFESSLQMLLERLKQRISPGDSARAERVQSWNKRFQQRKGAWEREALALAACKPIDTRWIVYQLNQVLPPDAVVVEETITHRLALHRYIDRLPRSSMFSGCCGGLGTGLGTALGVKTAFPKRPVLALIGDGSLNYNPVLAALGFAQEYETPILIVLFNNHGYLSMKSGLPKYYPEGWAVKTKSFVGTSIAPSPDYAAIARAFNGWGERVEDPAHVRPALEAGLRAVAAGQVGLIDFWLDPVN